MERDIDYENIQTAVDPADALPAAASFIVLLLGEWIARGSLTADTFISFIFPHFGAYLLAWLLLFLVWELLDWVLRIPPLATLGMAVLGCAPCAVNFYTMQLRGEPFLPWDLMQVSEAAGVASAAGLKLQTSMVVSIVLVLALTVASFFVYRGRLRQRWLPSLRHRCSAAALCLLIFGVYLQLQSRRFWASRRMRGCRTATTVTTVCLPVL